MVILAYDECSFRPGAKGEHPHVVAHPVRSELVDLPEKRL